MAHRDGVAAVDRAISVLCAFTERDSNLTLAELARRTGLIKSTVLRLAASLEAANCLQRSESGAYRLGPMLARFGATYQAAFRLGDHVMPALEGLAAATGESASLYIRDGAVRVCLHRVNSMRHQLLHFLRVGSQFPYDTGASGQVIRAFTDGHSADAAIRAQLVARSVRDRTIVETAAVAAPVFDATGTFVGAVSLAGPAARFSDEALPRLEAHVLRAARDITRSLGGASADFERVVAEEPQG
jgi:DNA-binding IclR family transcriptional regulator